MKRGFLVPALLIVSIFMVLCIGLLTRKPIQNLAALQTQLQHRARQIALAGVEEARLRLAAESSATPGNSTFSSPVKSPTGAPVGTYLVAFDYTWVGPPWMVVQIESEGFAGRTDRPDARYVLRATVDLSPDKRTGSGPNPDYLRVVRWRESVP